MDCVSGGGTPGMWQAHTHPEVTEHRAGTYVYGDRGVLKSGAMSMDEIAFSVITTVVSRPTADRGILDGGSKTFSSDLSGLEGYGLILEYPDAHTATGRTRAWISRCPRNRRRAVNDPHHCCTVSNLFNDIVGARNGAVEVVWPVAARGALQ